MEAAREILYIVINQLITIICPCQETFKMTVLTPVYSCIYACKHFCDKQSSTSEQTLWGYNPLI